MILKDDSFESRIVITTLIRRPDQGLQGHLWHLHSVDKPSIEKMSFLSLLLFSMGIFLVISDAYGALIVHRFLRTTPEPPLEIPEIRKIAADLKVNDSNHNFIFGAEIQISLPILQRNKPKLISPNFDIPKFTLPYSPNMDIPKLT